jgi:hypothetical protein
MRGWEEKYFESRVLGVGGSMRDAQKEELVSRRRALREDIMDVWIMDALEFTRVRKHLRRFGRKRELKAVMSSFSTLNNSPCFLFEL